MIVQGDNNKSKVSKEKKTLKATTPKEVKKSKTTVTKVTKKKSIVGPSSNQQLDKQRRSNETSPRKNSLDRKSSASSLVEGGSCVDETTHLQPPTPAVRPYLKGELAEDSRCL